MIGTDGLDVLMLAAVYVVAELIIRKICRGVKRRHAQRQQQL